MNPSVADATVGDLVSFVIQVDRTAYVGESIFVYGHAEFITDSMIVCNGGPNAFTIPAVYCIVS